MDVDERDHFAGLVRAVADERDQAAFTVLFDYYAPRLKSWLVKRSMRPDDAEELVQRGDGRSLAPRRSLRSGPILPVHLAFPDRPQPPHRLRNAARGTSSWISTNPLCSS